MSYCHLLPGSYSNISFTFGKDHIYGIDAFRIPNVMKNHVTARASSFPDCLALDNSNSILTVNKTGGGNGLVTSIPEGINCGPTCSAGFPESVIVTLTAAADTGSEFSGWSGDCTVDGQVTIDADKTCTATFNDIDLDDDDVADGIDNCLEDYNPDQADFDGDGIGDVCDQCPDDPLKTELGICGCGVADTDTDADGTADCNDQCPIDSANDADSDGVCGDIDNCPNIFNPNHKDSDKNGVGDICDSCNFYLIPNKLGGAIVICL